MLKKVPGILRICFLCTLPALSREIPENNDFYDNEPSVSLPGPEIEVGGEIANPCKVLLKKLPLRSLLVRETRLGEKGPEFIGVYRYEGYSLFDILRDRFVAKKISEN